MLLRLIAAAALLAAGSSALADGSNAGRPEPWGFASGGEPTLTVQGWRISAGYRRLLGRQTGLVADVIREQERALGEAVSIAEVGVRHPLSRETAFSLGIGAGTGGPSAPRWRVIAGFEQSF